MSTGAAAACSSRDVVVSQCWFKKEIGVHRAVDRSVWFLVAAYLCSQTFSARDSQRPRCKNFETEKAFSLHVQLRANMQHVTCTSIML